MVAYKNAELFNVLLLKKLAENTNKTLIKALLGALSSDIA